jgi:hypothetical protein
MPVSASALRRSSAGRCGASRPWVWGGSWRFCRSKHGNAAATSDGDHCGIPGTRPVEGREKSRAGHAGSIANRYVLWVSYGESVPAATPSPDTQIILAPASVWMPQKPPPATAQTSTVRSAPTQRSALRHPTAWRRWLARAGR